MFFITIGSVLGAVVMVLPAFFSDASGSEFGLFWAAAAKILGSSEPTVGALLHFAVATVIGIVVGIILYKTNMLNISKISSGIAFGVIAGIVVTVVFAFPVQYFLIWPIVAEISDTPAAGAVFSIEYLLGAFFSHALWGITLGASSSVMTVKKGMNYRCHTCDVEFSKISTFNEHHRYIHVSAHPDTKKIVILGGGYAGVGVLEKIQKRFEKDVDVSISIVSENNFFLHTPMLPELSTGDDRAAAHCHADQELLQEGPGSTRLRLLALTLRGGWRPSGIQTGTASWNTTIS